jgi:hypothetical protein
VTAERLAELKRLLAEYTTPPDVPPGYGVMKLATMHELVDACTTLRGLVAEAVAIARESRYPGTAGAYLSRERISRYEKALL